MKRTIGILLLVAGHVINLFVLLAGAVYFFGAVIWMHAPLLGALLAAAPMALPALGLPARLVVLEDPSGQAVSLLSWMEGRRDYQLWIDANIAREPLRDRLFALAASLPHGCRHVRTSRRPGLPMSRCPRY